MTIPDEVLEIEKRHAYYSDPKQFIGQERAWKLNRAESAHEDCATLLKFIRSRETESAREFTPDEKAAIAMMRETEAPSKLPLGLTPEMREAIEVICARYLCCGMSCLNESLSARGHLKQPCVAKKNHSFVAAHLADAIATRLTAPSPTPDTAKIYYASSRALIAECTAAPPQMTDTQQ